MRVIAGTAKGLRLASVPGEGTRPIGDRPKEALFNILGRAIEDARMLDLFAGTGSVGIEALSRGAASVVFVDNNPRAVQIITANLEHTRLESGASVRRNDAFRYLAASSDAPFDFVFLAPPQYQGLWKRALQKLDEDPRLLLPDAWIVVQIDPTEEEPFELRRLAEFDRRRYGKTLLVFYEFEDG